MADTTATASDRRWHGRWPLVVAVLIAAVAVAFYINAIGALQSGAFVNGEWVYAFDDAWGFDFEAYLDAARRLGESGTLYLASSLAGPFETGPQGLYYYAPPLGVLLTPLTGLGWAESSTLWYLGHVIALAAACLIMPVRPSVRLILFSVAAFSAAVFKDAVLGNVSVLLLLPLAFAWRFLDRPLGSIGLAMVICVRPSMGLFLVWQLLRRHWRAAAWTVIAGLAIVALTLPFVGVDGYVDYLTVLRNLRIDSAFIENHDLATVARRLGASPELAAIATLASALVAVVAVLLSLRRDPEIGFMVTLMASLLVIPQLWDHYLAALVLPAALLAQRGWRIAILLPLLAWLPADLAAALVLATMGLCLAAPAPLPLESQRPSLMRRAEGGHAPA